jgi:hypothetical protein
VRAHVAFAFQRMSAPTGTGATWSEEAWPDNTCSTPQKKLYFNDGSKARLPSSNLVADGSCRIPTFGHSLQERINIHQLLSEHDQPVPKPSGAVRSEPLFGEHVLKAFQDRDNDWAIELAKRLHEALHIDGAKLIERNEAREALKATSRTPRIRAPASGITVIVAWPLTTAAWMMRTSRRSSSDNCSRQCSVSER